MNTDWMMNLSLIWRGASEVFPYFDQRGADWDETYAAYLPRMHAAGSAREAYLLLAEFAALLGDGHTDVSFPKDLLEEVGYLPFQVRHIRDGWYVSAAAEEGQRLLTGRITQLNGLPFADWLAKLFSYIHQVDGHPSPSRVARFLPFLLPKTGNVLETTLGIWRFDLLPRIPAMTAAPDISPSVSCRELHTTAHIRLRLLEGDILCVGLPDLLDSRAADALRQALETLPKPRGVILDVRGCIGGATYFGANVARLLIPGRFHACRKWTRRMEGVSLASALQVLRMRPEALEKFRQSGTTDEESAKEMEENLRLSRRCLFQEYTDSHGQPGDTALLDQPCLLLTDRDTLSAAEDFTAMFRSTGRATILGERTYGSTGTPLLLPLRGGGTARVVSVGYRLLDGTEFINRGIQPDIPFALSPDDWQAGHDRLLDEAVRRLS